MKRYVTLTLSIFIISFVYHAFFCVIFGSYTPNLLISLPLALAYKNKSQAALFSAFLLGIFADLFVSGILGITSIYLLVTVYIYLILKTRIAYISTLTLVWIFVANLVQQVLIQNLIYSNYFNVWHVCVQGITTIFVTVFFVKSLNFFPREFLANKNNVDK